MCKSEKLKNSSPLTFQQPVFPSSQEEMNAGGTTTFICPPITPPSRCPAHLHSPSLESGGGGGGGSDSASSSVDEVGKKRKLGSSSGPSTAAAAAMRSKVACCASRSHLVVSPKQAVVPSPSPQGKELKSATTTFVQADTSSFRELVQKLTGVSDSDLDTKLPITLPSRQQAAKIDNSSFPGLIPKPVVDMSAPRPSFKLHERRQANLRKLEINRLGASSAAFSPGLLLPPSTTTELSSSPSNKKFSSPAACGPVTPGLTMEFFEKAYAPKTPTTPPSAGSCCTGLKSRSQHLEEEDRGKDAIPFLLHLSPSSDPTRPQPELLSLFPLASPHTSDT
jgi:hypothetical protein